MSNFKYITSLLALMLEIFFTLALCDIQCKDQSVCDDESTCCQMPSGEYGCCPMPDAVCCSDKLHCCPNGSTCDLTQMHCIDLTSGALSKRLLSKYPKGPKRVYATEHALEESTYCSLNSTCCKTRSGQLGICDMPRGVCCSDGMHCCSEGTSCDPESNSCQRTVPLLKKIRANISHSSLTIVCDDKSKCQDDTTCCKLATGTWGCCPMPNAVCCMDGIHCCPESTRCNLDEGRCEQRLVMHTMQLVHFEKPKNGKTDEVVAENRCTRDPDFNCPDGQTCCLMQKSKWGCCPTSEAVCCSDGQHCCPKNTICDMAKRRCVQNDVRALWLQTKIPWISVSNGYLVESFNYNKVGQKICPDQKKECAKTETCCMFKNTWSCCPFPNAVCCQDGHCCPNGETCGTSGQACVANDTARSI